MFEDKSTLIAQLKSPLNLASMALTEIENRLGGEKIIADPTSPFCHLLEFGSSITAESIQAIDDKLPKLYPQRATTMEDLYLHMSDYDYLCMYSSPASCSLGFTISKKYLTANSKTFNENYKQVTIPKDTVFMIGKYPFGLYYPINILINNYTNTFTAVYDTTTSNPLHELTKNIVDKFDFTYRGLDFITVTFPVYQFAKSIIEETVIPEAGFAKKYTYNNRFYALRAFSYSNGKYTELSLTQSNQTYDTTIPTLVMQLLPDEQVLKLILPQIYLDNNMIGSKLYIELYTTMGEMDIDATNISGDSIQINFNTDSKDTTAYSDVFKNLPFDSTVQIVSSKISGGSNGITVDELRERVVNNTLYEQVPITEDDIKVYLEDKNFYVKKYRDNVTERIYYAYRVLQDSNGVIIPSRTSQMKMQATYTDTRSATFKLQSDTSITVLPTTMYLYNEVTDDVIPITDEEYVRLSNMNKTELVAELNNNQYFRSPFHMRISLNDYYPKTVSYNLMSPSIETVIFEQENYNVAAKMIAYEGTIEHVAEGTGGYDLRISVAKSDDLAEVSEDDIIVYVTVKAGSYWIGAQATWEKDLDQRSIYKLHIATNYRLDDDQIGITNLQNESVVLAEHMVDLTSDFHIVYLVNRGVLSGTADDASSIITEGVPSMDAKYVALSRQYMKVKLGYCLSDVINHPMEISSTSKVYATWEYNVPRTYEEDVYEKDADGKLVTTTDEDGNITLNKLHSAGEEMVDATGRVIYEHKIGDIRKDINGNPIVVTDRNKIYFIDCMFIDAKVFASDRLAEQTFASELYNTLETYFATIRSLQEQLLELTYVYFRCVRSTGTAKFNLGDGVVSKQNVEMSFRINCYVPSYVKKSETIQNTIIEKTCETINSTLKTDVISMLEIFDVVKSNLSDYIDHFDLLGINNDIEMQTFSIIDEDVQPSVSRVLTLSDDNIISLTNDINITFIALEDNTSSTTSAST